MDIVDLTALRSEADSTLQTKEDNVFLLDMSDVCCEVDVGDIVTTSNDELKMDVGAPGVDSSKCGRQTDHIKASSALKEAWDHIKHLSKRQDSRGDDGWDEFDGCSDSDNESQNDCFSCANRAEKQKKDSSTQTDNRTPLMSIRDFRNRPDAILFYSGLESYDKFMGVFDTLVPECYDLSYNQTLKETRDVVDQFFLTLMKLRTNKDNLELSFYFGISERSVINIFETWIVFMYKMWTTDVDFWLPEDLVVGHVPHEFWNLYPAARVVIDCLEILIDKPSDKTAQHATFNVNRGVHSVKILVAVTPTSQVSFCSEAYGGATSDDEMFQLSGILNRLEPTDSVVLNKRFNVDEICAARGVTVHLRKTSGYKFSSLTAQSHNQSCPFKTLEHLVKKNQILSQKLSASLLPLASEICYVSVMISNFP